MSAPPAMDVLKGDAADMSPSQPKQTDIDIKLANGDAARTSPVSDISILRLKYSNRQFVCYNLKNY